MKKLEISPKKNRTKILAIRVTKEEKDSINTYCREFGVTKSDLVRFAFQISTNLLKTK